MKAVINIRRPIETASGDVSGLVAPLLVGCDCHGERVFDLYRRVDGGDLTHRGRRLVSAVCERHLQRAQAAPLLAETVEAVTRFKRVLIEDERLSGEPRIHEVVSAQKAIAGEVAAVQRLIKFWRFVFNEPRRSAPGRLTVKPASASVPTSGSADVSSDVPSSVRPAVARRSIKSPARAAALALFE